MANCDTTVIEVGSCTTGSVIDNENGTHTYFPGDGTSVTFPTLYLDSATFNTTSRVLTLTMSEGTEYTVTIPPAPDITDNLNGIFTVTYPDSTTFDIDTNNVVTTLIDNNDGTIIFTDEDGITTNIDICDVLQYCEINGLGNVNATPDASNIFLVYNSGTGAWEEGKANFVTISDQTGSAYNHLSLPSTPVSPPANPNINDVLIEVFNNGQIFWLWAGATWNRYYESYPTNSPTFTGTANVNAGVVTNDWEVNGDLIVDVIRPDIDGTSAIVFADQSGVPFITLNTNGQKLLYTGMGSDGGISIGNTGVHTNLEDAIIIGRNAASGTSQFYDGSATTESSAIIIGRESAFNSQINTNLIAIGKSAYSNNNGNAQNSLFIGGLSGADVTDVSIANATVIGYSAGRFATELSDSVLYGYAAGYGNEGTNVTIVGRSAGNNNLGANVTFVGRGVGDSNTGFAATGIGNEAGLRNSANYLVAIGYQTAQDNVGPYNIGVGFRALYQTTNVVGNNVAIGASALATTTGSANVAIGTNASVAMPSTDSVAVGQYALADAVSAYRTVAIGRDAGRNIDADFATVLGFYAGRDAASDRGIFLGAYQGQGEAVDAKLLIGAYDGVSIIEGDMSSTVSNQVLTLHADVNVDYDFAVDTDLFAVDTTNQLVSINADNASGENALSLESGYANVTILGSGTSSLNLERNQDSSLAYQIYFKKRRGDRSVPADIVNGDDLGAITFGGRYNGGVEASFAEILAKSGTGGNREGRLEFKVANGAGLVTKMRLNELGYLAVGQSISDSAATFLSSANYSGDPVGISGSCVGLFTRQNASAYIAVNSSTTGGAGLYLGDPDDIFAGGISYNNSDGIMTFSAENGFSALERFLMGTSSTTPLTALHINLGGFNGSPTGINTAQVGLLLSRQTSTTGIAINAGTTSVAYIDFGDENDVSASSITHNNANGNLTIRAETNINLDSITNYTVTMGNSTGDPTTDAPDNWIEVQIAGTPYYIPVYLA